MGVHWNVAIDVIASWIFRWPRRYNGFHDYLLLMIKFLCRFLISWVLWKGAHEIMGSLRCHHQETGSLCLIWLPLKAGEGLMKHPSCFRRVWLCRTLRVKTLPILVITNQNLSKRCSEWLGDAKAHGVLQSDLHYQKGSYHTVRKEARKSHHSTTEPDQLRGASLWRDVFLLIGWNCACRWRSKTDEWIIHLPAGPRWLPFSFDWYLNFVNFTCFIACIPL